MDPTIRRLIMQLVTLLIVPINAKFGVDLGPAIDAALVISGTIYILISNWKQVRMAGQASTLEAAKVASTATVEAAKMTSAATATAATVAASVAPPPQSSPSGTFMVTPVGGQQP